VNRVFFTSDNHYFHENIIRYCQRPFDGYESMNAEMIHRWNSMVNHDDIGIFVGDISAGLKGRVDELREIIKSLNGRKILIRGNHDHQPDDWYLDSGFLKVVEAIKFGSVVLTHYPLSSLERRGLRGEDLFGEFSYIVHGHVHDPGPNFERHYNVAADRNNFMPVTLDVAIPQSFQQAFMDDLLNFL
jgi:calcineurin-like phosphoesterase family protein